MPELPFPPDLDQLRRQARELLRAAAQGEPDALARLHAVSDRVVLSAAQLAVAREYGFRSWPALKAAVERDRSTDMGAKPPAPAAVSPDLLEPPEQRRSFGGAAAIETAGGVLLPELLVVGRGHAVLDASLVPPAPATAPLAAWPSQRLLSQKERLAELRRQTRPVVPTFDDVTVTDDRGTTYALKVAGIAGYPVEPGPEPRPVGVIFRLEPAPAREAAWIELRADNGPGGLAAGRRARQRHHAGTSGRERPGGPGPLADRHQASGRRGRAQAALDRARQGRGDPGVRGTRRRERVAQPAGPPVRLPRRRAPGR
jgi:hypothetical protein